VTVALPRFYPIVDVKSSERADLALAHDRASALARAGVCLLQLRAKTLGAGPFTELAASLVGDLSPFRCRVIINDRADIALATGAAGVHLGDEDLPVCEARRLLGPAALIGYSTHSVNDIEAAPAEADYLGFGPVFDSPTKAGVREARGLDLLAAACKARSRPVVAIGGVTLAHAPSLWRAGAAAAAVISEVERSSDIEALVRAWTATFPKD
jgi:thiamine-phosphate pyrophosphorylase